MRVRRYRVDESGVLNPGLLRHQITWQQKALSGQNGFGEDVYVWSDVLTCRAQVKALEGRELEMAQQKWAEARYMVLQPYSKGLADAMRLSWFVDGRFLLLDVLNINDPPGTGRYQTIIAKDYE